jgi:sirohydrochlorin cobaltochelatase
MTSTGILLAGHGSHISPNTAGLVWECVDQLRRLRVADEVSAAFWKEQPSFHEAIRAFTADDITVIPVFTTRGFFTQQVIPAEMGLSGAITQRDGRTIRYTRTLSETGFLTQMTQQRVQEALQKYQLQGDQCAVAIIGHSTRRNPESRKATEEQALAIRTRGMVKEAVAVYLDDMPEISEIYALTSAPTLIAVPFFMAEGSHVTGDVPRELGLNGSAVPQTVQGRTVYYTAPTGTDAQLVEALLWLAYDAKMPEKSSPANGFPSFGRDLLWEHVNQNPFQFGQLWLQSDQVRFGNSTTISESWTPGSLRTMVRTHAANHFRFHATGHDLPPDLPAYRVHNADDLHAIVETIYPGAVALWAQGRMGTFRANTFEATTARQVGQFRELANMSEERKAEMVGSICSKCARHPSWFDGNPGELPCPEPCNLWLSATLSQR